mmetsp:Transcript_43723/g.105456  ORF Transcript_43723/g.105456 Transcript_43723/m.105456 type:complete len:87 (+) Transcript_43723:195-455(+)|eukprot:CAMPEP_0113614678 /NCGR_PEP_ID=MMETSP0017_2-20120614/7299_1 /TAXON_ID=2856 /ORGANISM="Cylindrotheca closterium" /LENGTH=86 /DNA_ID=CAMNT_0000523871 /DNA_START=107 /DNA_END=367 /DNA_ORIENTATION=- /assembly_acc=CAM_ASM_000147
MNANTNTSNMMTTTTSNLSISDLSTSTQGSVESNVSAGRKLQRLKRKLLLDYVANNDTITNDDASISHQTDNLSLVNSANPSVACY